MKISVLTICSCSNHAHLQGWTFNMVLSLGVILKIFNNPKKMVGTTAPTSSQVNGVSGESRAKEDSHSWGRLGGGQVVDVTLNICPKGASVAAGVQVCSGRGRKSREDGSHVGAAEGWLGQAQWYSLRVLWGLGQQSGGRHWLRQKEKGLRPQSYQLN